MYQLLNFSLRGLISPLKLQSCQSAKDGVFPFSAIFSRKNLKIFTWPLCKARSAAFTFLNKYAFSLKFSGLCSGEHASKNFLGSAEFSMRNLTTGKFPAKAAQCKRVPYTFKTRLFTYTRTSVRAKFRAFI